MAGQFPIFTVYSKRYFAGLFVFWCVVSFGLFYFSKAAGFTWLRTGVGGSGDYFFKYFTHAGDGVFSILLALYFLFRKKMSLAFLIGVGFAVSGILVQIGKYFFAMPRPDPYFKALGQTIEGVSNVALLQSFTSFPSGHTATAFATATALVLMSRWWQKQWWLAGCMAVLVGYSRVYLGQHFPLDVLVGSVIGVLSAVGCWAWLQYRKPRFMLHD